MSFTTEDGSDLDSGYCRLRAAADMSIYGAADNQRALLRILERYSRFEVDLSRVNEIDCSGVQLLLAAARAAARAHKPFHLHSPSAPVAEVLDLLDLGDRFEWVDPPC